MAASAVISVVVRKYEKLLQLDEASGTKVSLGLNSSIERKIIQELKRMKSFLLEEEAMQMKREEKDEYAVLIISESILQVLCIAYELEDAVDISFLEELRRSRQAYSTLNRSGICILSIWRIILSVKLALKATGDTRLKSNLEKILTKISGDALFKSLPPPEPSSNSSSTQIPRPPDHDHTAAGNPGIPSHLMGCLLYVGMFPKEMHIPIRRLIRLWLAEGLVIKKQLQRPSGGDGDGDGDSDGDDKTCTEDLAMEYLADLERRGMIRRSISDGSPKTCRLISGELYKKFSLQAEKIGLLHIHKARYHGTSPAPPPFPVRRVVEYASIKNYPQSDDYVKSLRSYVSFNFQKKDTEAAQIGEFVRIITLKRGYSLLTVLDLERVYKPALPDKIGNLYNLRYLGLRWTFLDALPSSVENLTLLQTLDLKHTYIKYLPIQLHKMRELRHLYLNDIPMDRVLPLSSLSNCMQTLSGLVVDKKEAQGIDQLSDLKKLVFTCDSACSEELGKWISSVLTHLLTLKLTCKVDDETGKPSSLHLQTLVRLEKLTNIYLVGKIPKLEANIGFEFPRNVRVLALSFSMLEEDPMPMLGQLPNLVVLGLYASSYTGTRLLSAQDAFGSLRVLKLWGLKNLEEWMVGQGAMKNLQKLEIRLCDKLEGVPTRLVKSSAFEELTLTHMPKNMVADVEEYCKRKKRSTIETHPWKLVVVP